MAHFKEMNSIKPRSSSGTLSSSEYCTPAECLVSFLPRVLERRIGHEPPSFGHHPSNLGECFTGASSPLGIQPLTWEEVRTLVSDLLNVFLFPWIFFPKPKNFLSQWNRSPFCSFPPFLWTVFDSSHSFPSPKPYDS